MQEPMESAKFVDLYFFDDIHECEIDYTVIDGDLHVTSVVCCETRADLTKLLECPYNKEYVTEQLAKTFGEL